jgi:hypothetical protein
MRLSLVALRMIDSKCLHIVYVRKNVTVELLSFSFFYNFIQCPLFQSPEDLVFIVYDDHHRTYRLLSAGIQACTCRNIEMAFGLLLMFLRVPFVVSRKFDKNLGFLAQIYVSN